MKNCLLVLLFLNSSLLSSISFAQGDFSDCAAAFLDNQMIVEEYANGAKCKLSILSKGILSAGTVNLGDVSRGEKKFQITEKISFSIAKKDANSGTVTMFSNKKYKQIKISKVLSKCKPGDFLIIMTLNSKYSLPHNEILIF